MKKHPGRRSLPLSSRQSDLALVLSGGNAVGAYLAGACEVLDERELQPSWIVGGSVGAVTGAILAGNPRDERMSRLRQFWDEAAQHTGWSPTDALKPRQYYNALHAFFALAWGRPSIYRQRLPGLWSAFPGVPNDVALFDHGPLRETLERLVDFGRLTSGETRLTVTCVDVESGEEVYFDSHKGGIRPEHIMASTAIMPMFPPVEVEGRLLCDAGYTNNLPLDPLFEEEPRRDLVCIALDLFGLKAPRPASLDAVLERTNDLIFASASRRAIAGLRREYALREKMDPNGPKVTLLHLAYQAGADEVAAKSFDYSPSSVRDRWAAGSGDMVIGLDRLEAASGDPHSGRFTYLRC